MSDVCKKHGLYYGGACASCLRERKDNQKQIVIDDFRKQLERLQVENEKYRKVIERCIKAMVGSNCNELHWLEQALKG